MRIGFANIYSWRPHVEHLYYLARLAQGAGHETAFLTCDSSVSNCYSRMLKGRARLRECPLCMLGGVRSFPVSNVTALRHGGPLPDRAMLDAFASSSAATLTRIEAEEEYDDPDVAAKRAELHDAVATAYLSARRWIADQKLEALICFNGRMDMTAAVTRAASDAGIPYITHERTWFGDGLSLNVNANCLSIRGIGAMTAAFDGRPLTRAQAAYAARLVAERFLRKNALEWKIYNKDALSTRWPVEGEGRRVLVLPSSKNEYFGLREWQAEWADNTDALDDFFAATGIAPGEVVVRCHPNWAESIGVVGGNRSLIHYKEWCAARDIFCISSEEKHSTYDLIQQADIVVLNGGSAAVEAGACGKQIFSLGPAFYQDGGFVKIVNGPADLKSPLLTTPLDPDAVIRKTLRFVYVAARRFPQFNHFVRARRTTEYDYYEGADFTRIERMLRTGEAEPDDPAFAADESEETPIVEALRARDWPSLVDHVEERPALEPMDIGRRAALRWLDGVRSRMGLGHDA